MAWVALRQRSCPGHPCPSSGPASQWVLGTEGAGASVRAVSTKPRRTVSECPAFVVDADRQAGRTIVRDKSGREWGQAASPRPPGADSAVPARPAGVLTCPGRSVPCALGAALGWCAAVAASKVPSCARGPRVYFALSPTECDTGPAPVRRTRLSTCPRPAVVMGRASPLCACAPDSLLLCPGSQGVMPAEQPEGCGGRPPEGRGGGRPCPDAPEWTLQGGSAGWGPRPSCAVSQSGIRLVGKASRGMDGGSFPSLGWAEQGPTTELGVTRCLPAPVTRVTGTPQGCDPWGSLPSL